MTLLSYFSAGFQAGAATFITIAVIVTLVACLRNDVGYVPPEVTE